MWTNMFLFLWIIGTVKYKSTPIQRNCGKHVRRCPMEKDQWERKNDQMSCTTDFRYVCLKDADGYLFETCMANFTVPANTSNCPVLYTCYNKKPYLGQDTTYHHCPQDMSGCPPRNHTGYNVHQLYKYPKCIESSISDEIENTSTRSTTSESITTITSDHTIRQENNLIVSLIVNLALVLLIFGCVISYVLCTRMRNVDVKNTRTDREESPLLERDIAAKEFRKTLYIINYNETKRIPVSPLQKTSTMSMEELFAPVSIREDLEYRLKGQNIGTQEKRTKPVNSPDDMFLIDGDKARSVFMLGDAAMGKSVFCLRLVENWCKANAPYSTDKSLNPWVRDLKKFDFLFLVQLRHVDSSRTSVIDMICNDVFQHHPGCHDVIRRVISGEKYRCLIVIDGLDEWKISDEAKRKLKVEGLPNTEGMANCTFVWSMRPWVMDRFSDIIRGNDRVVEIQGLYSDSINIVIENLLVNFYELDKTSVTYKEKVREIKEKSQDSNLRSIMQSPFIAIACTQIWYEEKNAGKSMSSLYVALIEMLIRRSNQKSPLPAKIMDRLSEKSSEIANVPKILVQKKNIRVFISVLMKLGKVAKENLLSNRTYLVLSIEDYESCLEKNEIEFALKSGLLSKREAPGSCDEENVSINFFHKSIQEFLAAVYIENHGEMSKIAEHLSSIKAIMELGNVLIFLSGFNPMLGRCISQYIVNVANCDKKICKYRTLTDILIYRNEMVELLYKLQASCYREITYSQLSTENTQVVPYHISDISVRDDSDIETIRTTVDILTHHHADITSLLLHKVPTDIENGVPDSVLTQFLDHTVSLQSLLIDGNSAERTVYKISDRFSSLTALVLTSITLTPDAIDTLHTALQSNTLIQTLGLVDIKCQVNKDQGREPALLSDLIQILPDLPRLSTLYLMVTHKDDKPVFRDVLSRLSHLHGIGYYYTFPRDAEYDCGVVQTLCTWLGLRWLTLVGVSLGDSGLQLSHDMLRMETVRLLKVDMLPSGWISFIQSVLNINHKLDIKLLKVDIDKKYMTMVRQSAEFNITHEKVDDDGTHELYFTRV